MSFWRNYYHLIWTTKDRKPLITPILEPRLYAYLVAKAAELDVFTYAIGGIMDHVHLVVAIPPRHSVAGVVGRLKGASSHFVNHTIRPDTLFAWQTGYGCLTVGERQRHVAVAYVRNQRDHHAQATINVWLERCLEDEDGAQLTGGPRCVTGGVHEPPAAYDLDILDLPF